VGCIEQEEIEIAKTGRRGAFGNLHRDVGWGALSKNKIGIVTSGGVHWARRKLEIRLQVGCIEQEESWNCENRWGTLNKKNIGIVKSGKVH
jgi:hypothetical protein